MPDLVVSFTIEIADDEALAANDHWRLEQAVQTILEDARIRAAEISIAIVDDAQMHELNRQYLDHDYTTDVLSFVLEHNESSGQLDGEIIVNANYAAREAERYGWSAGDELLLYVIHGALHLTGHDDTTVTAKQTMRQAEAKYLSGFGLQHRYEAD